MNNSKIANFRKPRNFLIFQVEKIPRIYNFENSKNCQFGKLEKFPVGKISKISNLENTKNCQFVKSRKLTICKILKILYLKNSKKFLIWKTPSWQFQKFAT